MHFRVHRGPRHARCWRDGVESTIGPAGLNLRRLEGVSESSRSEEDSQRLTTCFEHDRCASAANGAYQVLKIPFEEDPEQLAPA